MTIEEHPDPVRRWRVRRRMAIASLAAGILFPCGYLFAQQLGDIAWPYLTFLSVPISVYIGGATLETIKTQVMRP